MSNRPHKTISIHALLAESDNILCVVSIQVGGFLSTLSLRRATAVGRAGRFYSVCISIHALLAESDDNTESRIAAEYDFYPRSPCGERRAEIRASSQQEKFLSTLSLRRATGRHRGNDGRPVHFYPRSPCGERPDIFFDLALQKRDFYPRSPCGERPFSRVP